jgi:CHAT domain-containing protein
MLKEEESFDYLRGDADNAPKGEKAALTPKEKAVDKRYREVADKLAALGAERSALLNKPARTPEEEKRLVQIESGLVVAGQAFQKFLDKLSDELKTTKDAGKVSQLRDAQGLMEDLRELGQGAVALYTIVGEDTFSIVLTTADLQKAYQVPIKAADLNRKVSAFRQALQSPALDPQPLAQELYRTLLAPVEKDLRAAQAQLLMWSLDGVLRYVPMAALHDGERYLVERYRHAVFTPASNARLHFAPSRNWRALGLGVTKAHGANIPALPGVVEEMRGIIKTENTSGVLPGTIKLDEQFTQESMLAGLRERNNVVHIASHFQFQPGNETNSALLLGDGQLLSLAQIKALPNVFGGVELLTLSACNTATSGSGANGKEVEGFGVLAQRQGAKAVVASLWPVADRLTKNLMQEFYQLREAKADVTKVEALRQAQIKLLRGELQVTGEMLAAREIIHEAPKATNQPLFKPDAKAPYAHPYYWAPFILIGNWK